MKSNLLKAVVACIVFGSLSVSSQVFAGETFNEWYANQIEQLQNPTSQAPSGGSTPTSVPELDNAGAPIALALIGGIAGIALERRRKKKSN